MMRSQSFAVRLAIGGPPRGHQSVSGDGGILSGVNAEVCGDGVDLGDTLPPPPRPGCGEHKAVVEAAVLVRMHPIEPPIEDAARERLVCEADDSFAVRGELLVGRGVRGV